MLSSGLVMASPFLSEVVLALMLSSLWAEVLMWVSLVKGVWRLTCLEMVDEEQQELLGILQILLYSRSSHHHCQSSQSWS